MMQNNLSAIAMVSEDFFSTNKIFSIWNTNLHLNSSEYNILENNLIVQLVLSKYNLHILGIKYS